MILDIFAVMIVGVSVVLMVIGIGIAVEEKEDLYWIVLSGSMVLLTVWAWSYLLNKII